MTGAQITSDRNSQMKTAFSWGAAIGLPIFTGLIGLLVACVRNRYFKLLS